MNKESNETLNVGEIELLQASNLPMTSEALLKDFSHYFTRVLGRRTVRPNSPLVYQALVFAIRDRLMERWGKTRIAMERSDTRRVGYISLEFLTGRLLRNALLNLDLETQASEALEHIGLELENVYDTEHDAGLGNGGLGRLAACFLDSCATLRLPVVGYGIRYQYGMFRQCIVSDHQVEEPDPWLREGFPWEVERFEFAKTIRFGGRTTTYTDDDGRVHSRWVDTNNVLAIPFDIPVPGYKNNVVNTLRLWSASSTDEFDLDEFNAGSYTDAVAAKNAAENITMILYPNADTENGQELRLRQQYFLVSASLQDTLRFHLNQYDGRLDNFSDKNCLQLNDTHPALAIPELMRLLIDEHAMEWDNAWAITRRTMAYTNHTLLPEALEVWPVALFERLLPRVLEIIYEINARFLEEIRDTWPEDVHRVRDMSLVQEGDQPMVRMAHLAIVGSFSVNGVAALHSDLLQKGLFREFAELWPRKFNNKTNGVTQRRWLAACNPALAKVITDKIGSDWITDLSQLQNLTQFLDDPEFRSQWQHVKLANKSRLALSLKERTGHHVPTTMLFDVQVKRIHEYKRQLLNLLHAIHLYNRILRGDTDIVPRAIIIGGKAAPGYVMAKNIIRAINSVAHTINHATETQDLLRLLFYPDYNVSAMEMICPAADLSAQISTAGKEASGTGNMKFMINGAITIGTLDGANVEIREAVGKENFFLFGATVDEVAKLKNNYDPQSIINTDKDFYDVVKLLETAHFNPSDPTAMEPLVKALQSPHDPWMTAADFRSFVDTQARVGQTYANAELWTSMSIRNTAASGRFSTDRTMQEYNRDIWNLKPLNPADSC
ncbi:MAG: glycogen/starch/alpha-glucan phosphorylase [Pseudomonadota bacterium]